MTILTEDDFSLFTRFKIRAMGDKLREIIDDESMDHMGFEEKIKLMLDAETIARSDRKVERLIGQARFKYKDASIEGIQYPPDRKLSRERVERLATCQWIRDRETLIIISSTGSGKSYISQALGNAACRQGIPTRYTRLQDMLEQINRARLDGQGEYYRKVDEFKTIRLLTLDDFLTPRSPRPTASSCSRSWRPATAPGPRSSPANANPGNGTCASAASSSPTAPSAASPEPPDTSNSKAPTCDADPTTPKPNNPLPPLAAGTSHTVPAVPLSGDPITKPDYYPRGGVMARRVGRVSLPLV
ncbi:ATP-binding protein [Bifidobacterium platyrrhinorum]|uniref:IstB-like ATP-binding domain-containing protein n=1 Tax=Bifidobacterium platyrrhinorum TaxID=2661628 RepID=A0A6L9SQD5_9BIFI|nr:ATP-binding protein [Bifidobacterium platyrrhinorum]NEG54776.1 hypothetical protein [Bifidobacterium platyrrhinorum]